MLNTYDKFYKHTITILFIRNKNTTSRKYLKYNTLKK